MGLYNMTTQNHINKLNHFIEKTQLWQDKFVPQFDQLSHIKNIFTEKLDRFSQEEQTLNIAIMGQVKAGKSSFLNALLFEGKPILPEAATPKTANLTRISHADTHRLEVEFYNQEDWRNIIQLAKSDSEDQQTKVAKEQVSMIEQTGIDANALIAQGAYVQEADNLDQIMSVLNDYAGNDGKYTGLVKMIRLYLPLPELEGYNIIDTPGMNDPVVSRTQRTKEEMANSDVVFFLSRASNFLDKSDIDLLSNQLPEAGVKRLVLVAGQYDSAIEQDGFDRSNLAETEKNLHKRIIGRANKDLTQLADIKTKAGQIKVANILRTITEPVFSSTYAYGFANWDKEKWSASMHHSYSQLVEMAEEEWGGYKFTNEDWQRIAGFMPLKTAYENAKAEKAIIIEEQKQSLLPEAEHNFLSWLNDFQEQVHQRTLTLEQGDLASLDKQQKKYESQISNISNKLEEVIDTAISNAKNRQQEITRELKKGIQQSAELKTRTGTETHEESYTVSTSSWYKPWTWGNSETRYRTVSVDYEYLSVADAIDQVTNFAYNCQSDIEYHFSQLVNPNIIKAELRKSLLDALDTNSPDFDPAQFRNMVNQSISSLKIPDLKLDIGDAGNQISKSFSGQVRSEDDKIRLKQQLRDALHQVFDKLTVTFNQAVNEIVSSLGNVKNSLESIITRNMQTELAQLEDDFSNKQAVLVSYKELEKLVSNFKNQSN
jgi:hypothetical protein